MSRNRTSWAGGVAVLAVVTSTAALAQVGTIPSGADRYYNGPGMMWGSDQWGGFGMVLGPVFMILIVVGILASLVYLARLFDGGASATRNADPHGGRSLGILKERFARGEIDAGEFEERKKLLVD